MDIKNNTFSPIEVETLLQIHYLARPVFTSPAQQGARARLAKLGLIAEYQTGMWVLTTKGQQVVNRILNVPLTGTQPLANLMRFTVDGHETADPNSEQLGDGKYPPFYVFDVERQENVLICSTREEAQVAATDMNISNAMRGPVGWGPTQQAEALSHGWGLFTGSDDTAVRLEKYDEGGRFKNDDEAIRHVWTAAGRCDVLAITALAFVRIWNPGEYEGIRRLVVGAPPAPWHPNDDWIRKVLEGKVLQHRFEGRGEWFDFDSQESALRHLSALPHPRLKIEYREKPKNVVFYAPVFVNDAGETWLGDVTHFREHVTNMNLSKYPTQKVVRIEFDPDVKGGIAMVVS